MTDNYPYMLIVSYGFPFVKYILHKVADIFILKRRRRAGAYPAWRHWVSFKLSKKRYYFITLRAEALQDNYLNFSKR